MARASAAFEWFAVFIESSMNKRALTGRSCTPCRDVSSSCRSGIPLQQLAQAFTGSWNDITTQCPLRQQTTMRADGVCKHGVVGGDVLTLLWVRSSVANFDN
eukprot:243989-Chlamydomonas_euryale.AAC.1